MPNCVRTLVAFHASCADGYGAASAFAHLENHMFFPIRHNSDNFAFWNMLAADSNCDVVMLDITLSGPEMDKIAQSCNRLYWIDHHIGAKDECVPHWFTDSKPDNVVVVYDENHSGAWLAWNHITLGAHIPELIYYIEDRDLHRFHLDNSRIVGAGLWDYMDGFHYGRDARFETPRDVACELRRLALNLNKRDIQSIMQSGIVICRKIDSIASRAFANRVLFHIGDYQFFGAFSTEHVSDCGERIAEATQNVSVILTPLAKEMCWIVHVRSYNGLSLSALDVASMIGGGGQKNAAGAKIHWNRLRNNEDGSFTILTPTEFNTNKTEV